jgi:hypothetical protein
MWQRLPSVMAIVQHWMRPSGFSSDNCYPIHSSLHVLGLTPLRACWHLHRCALPVYDSGRSYSVGWDYCKPCNSSSSTQVTKTNPQPPTAAPASRVVDTVPVQVVGGR